MSIDTRPMKPLSVELRLRASKLDVRAQFRVSPGRVCALVGRPGSGKSGLLKAVAGLRPAQGRVWLEGTDLATLVVPTVTEPNARDAGEADSAAAGGADTVAMGCGR